MYMSDVQCTGSHSSRKKKVNNNNKRAHGTYTGSDQIAMITS